MVTRFFFSFFTFQSWQNRSLRVCARSSLKYSVCTHPSLVEHMRDREKERERGGGERGTTLKTIMYKESIISRVFVLNSTAFAKPASALASMACKKKKKLQSSINLTSSYGETSD